MIIKIGLLLDSMRVPSWQQRIITYITNSSSFSVRLIVLNGSARSGSSGNAVYKAIRRIDRLLFFTQYDCFQRVDLSACLAGVEIMQARPIRSTFTDELTGEEIASIKTKELDIFIRFGFRILIGDILNVTRLGVWSLHHGDNAVNRGGPPAFWEVVEKDTVTGVTLQILSSNLDGGIVINKAFIRTDRTSFYRNQNALYWAGIELFCDALRRLATDGTNWSKEKLFNSGKDFYSMPLYRNPSNWQALMVFIAFLVRRIGEVAQSVLVRQQWSLFYKLKQGPFETSLFRYKRLRPPAGTDWADPFVIWKDNRYVVFLEELVHAKKKGHISYIEFSESGELISTKPTPILSESYHLSYPFLQRHEDSLYMVPESASCNNVWLYRCEKFPQEWEKFKLLLKDTALYDPTLVHHQNTWYMFGTQRPLEGNSPDQYLYIYYADNLLTSSWQSHPQNPVKRDVRGARPAGKIFERKGRLIRPAQIGAPKYGYGIRLFEIMKLTRQEFEERELEDILPNWQKNLLATHTFNFEKGFSIVDAQAGNAMNWI